MFSFDSFPCHFLFIYIEDYLDLFKCFFLFLFHTFIIHENSAELLRLGWARKMFAKGLTKIFKQDMQSVATKRKEQNCVKCTLRNSLAWWDGDWVIVAYSAFIKHLSGSLMKSAGVLSSINCEAGNHQLSQLLKPNIPQINLSLILSFFCDNWFSAQLQKRTH